MACSENYWRPRFVHGAATSCNADVFAYAGAQVKKCLEITKELGITRENIAEFESILASEKKLRGVIVKELEEVRKQYGDERRTKIEDEAAEIQLEDLIADEQTAVTVSHSGYMKRTPIFAVSMAFVIVGCQRPAATTEPLEPPPEYPAGSPQLSSQRPQSALHGYLLWDLPTRR